MLNIFGAIGSMLPGYVEGQRNAIKDNWDDLQNYNTVQAGQIQNAFDEATFHPRIEMFRDQEVNSRLGRAMNEMTYARQEAMFPWLYQTGLLQAQMSPMLAWYNNAAQMNLLQQMQQNPFALAGMMRMGQMGLGDFTGVNNNPSALQW